jgi:hypothetical protein
MQKIISFFSYSGRINRVEYALGFIFTLPAALMISRLYNFNPPSPLIAIFIYLYFAQGVKRCHDRGIIAFMVFNPANMIFNFTEKSFNRENEHGLIPLNPHWFQRIFLFFKRVYILTLNFENKQKKAWKSLKSFFEKSEWRYGIFENGTFIQCYFEITQDSQECFAYVIDDVNFKCIVKVLDAFPVEQTSDVFILASHLNNLSRVGVVIVNIQDNYVQYLLNRDFIVPFLYESEFSDQIIAHHSYSKDIYWAFQKLINENEEPAIIIGDLLRRNENRNSN